MQYNVKQEKRQLKRKHNKKTNKQPKKKKPFHAPSFNLYICTNMCHNLAISTIRESVDSLCRDGSGPPIVCVHWKAVLTRERSCFKPFWTPSYPIRTFLYSMLPPKSLKGGRVMIAFFVNYSTVAFPLHLPTL